MSDEPTYTLRASDKHAGVVLHLLALMRLWDDGDNSESFVEPGAAAEEMTAWFMAANPDVTPGGMAAAATAVAMLADVVGAVVEIDLVPLKPLGMGHYEHRVHVRPRRGLLA